MQTKRKDEKFRESERTKDRLRRAESRRSNTALREREKARDRQYQRFKQIQDNISGLGGSHVLPVFAKEEEVVCTMMDEIPAACDLC